MQGINRSKHEHLRKALLQLTHLSNEGKKDHDFLQQAGDYREKLESLFSNYEQLLDDLERLIAEYELLYTYVKTHVLGRKLKELKKEIHTEEPSFLLLVENIHVSYGT